MIKRKPLNNNLRKYSLLLALSFYLGFVPVLKLQAQAVVLNADTVKAGKYDNGKMWTFDNPPAEHFQNAYNFRPDEEWFNAVQMAALRFATYCSASFVSANGLVMTNHHCARESGTAVQKKGEDLNKNGFYAAKLTDERKVPELFVDQLAKIADITGQVQGIMNQATSDAEQLALQDSAYARIKREYAQKADWKGLELQTVRFYNGGKYSLYGFKRYKDVRLVFMPELQLGFFGGDADNFTYPRYCLDASFFRVYDESGKPLKTKYYYKFNPAGAAEGDPVFVIGNPGSTKRINTVSDLEYDRDVYYPIILKLIKNRSTALQEYNETAKNDSIQNEAFSLENAFKAFTGQLEGLRDPYIMARRGAFERDFKKAVQNNDSLRDNLSVWDEISQNNSEIRKVFHEYRLFQPHPLFQNQGLALANQIASFAGQMQSGGAQSGNSASKEAMEKQQQKLLQAPTSNNKQLEELFLAAHLEEALHFLGENDPYVKAALNGRTPEEAAAAIMNNTKLYDPKFRQELFSSGMDAVMQSKDPLLELARAAEPRFRVAAAKVREITPKLSALRGKLGRMQFEIYGTSIPPDATFSLRINDGVVKGYEYNGTVAPYKTTYFGLYDRYYSFNKEFPWSLPAKWQNPPMELLRSPYNFVSTNDIIGGNSGSAIINKNREAVGLIFDGNIESLPGNYIYLPESNRAVSVHAGGIVAALRYIYKADRIVNELVPVKK